MRERECSGEDLGEWREGWGWGSAMRVGFCIERFEVNWIWWSWLSERSGIHCTEVRREGTLE